MFTWPTERPLIIAHRGARSLAPENTLAAARKALAVGADMWECDVHTTADGVVVLMHDATLERTTDAARAAPERAPWRLADWTLADVERLDAGSWFLEQDPYHTLADGEVSAEEAQTYVHEHVPTLQEALAFTKAHHWRLMLEIKDETDLPGDRTIVEQVVDAVVAVDLLDQVVIASFNPRYLERARRHEDRVTTMLLAREAPPDPVRAVQGVGAQVYGPALAVVTEEAVAAVREAGMATFVWTVNEVADMRRLIRWGVQGIITDYPQRLRALLHAGEETRG